MCDFADLHFLRIERIRRAGRGRFYTVAFATPGGEQASRCPHCGGQLRGHGRKSTTYRDLPDGNGSVAIVVERLRFRCADCRSTSLQKVAEMDERFRMTERLVERIRVDAVRRPFTSIAGEIGIHERTVRRIVRDRLPALTRSRLSSNN
jgi:transposase